MNILVTGGAGYIGSHVSLNLLNAAIKWELKLKNDKIF